MSRKRTLAETDANVARIEVPKKPKMANKSKESAVRVPYSFVEPTSVLVVANKCHKAVLKIAAAIMASRKSDGTRTTETEDVLSDATSSLQPLKRDISGDDIHSRNPKEVEYEKKARGREQAGKGTDTGPPVADLGDTGTISTKGLELAQEWAKQQQKRCQDNYNMHIFNDWNAYGISEVIENIVREYLSQGQRIE